jgi:hypothetical protein
MGDRYCGIVSSQFHIPDAISMANASLEATISLVASASPEAAAALTAVAV